MKRPVFIWVRRTVDYADTAAFEAQLSDRFRRGIALWDRTFTIPFAQFRQRVKQIAQANLAAVKGARVTTDWNEIPDGAIVLPVDDDDWFSPATAIRAQQVIDGDAVGCLWPPEWVEVATGARHLAMLVGRRLRRAHAPPYPCATNNYAITKRPGTYEHAARHLAASAWYESGGSARMVELPESLSLINRTLASQTSMLMHGAAGRPTTAVELRLKRRRYRAVYRDTGSRPRWSHPYLGQMADLVDRLEPRGRPIGRKR